MREKKKRTSNELTLLQKGKKGFWQIIFGRTMFGMMMVFLQWVIVWLWLYYLSSYVQGFLTGVIVLEIAMVIYILNDRGNPAIKLSWIVVIMLAPILGITLYLWSKEDVGHRAYHRALGVVERESKEFAKQNPETLETVRREAPELYSLVKYLRKNGDHTVHGNTKAKYFSDGTEYFNELIDQLENAESFIFLEYFIISEGYMWGRVLNVLERKAKEGVEVRLMYDGMCSLMELPYNYPEKIRALGIECKPFSPIHPFVSTHYNNRDHRKIVVIDGRVAFTGGINLADEYINLRKRFGYWKDIGIMLEGEAVCSFTLMFLRMWNAENALGKKNRKDGLCDDYEKYMMAYSDPPSGAAGYVVPYADSPLDNERIGEMVYLDMLNRSVRYVHIMTPYLILDHEMETALKFTAKRGVDVSLILPHIPDKKYAFYLAKTHYRSLIEAGVRIYEFTPGFVHAKLFVSDDIRGSVGSINLDYRSLYHHFECAAYLYKVPELKDMEIDFQRTLLQCRRVTMEDVRKEKLLTRVCGSLLKLVAPLM